LKKEVRTRDPVFDPIGTGTIVKLRNTCQSTYYLTKGTLKREKNCFLYLMGKVTKMLGKGVASLIFYVYFQIDGDNVLASLPRLILSAIRFIPNIVDTTGMADKIAEILQVRTVLNAHP
jgi:hypothetical protein